MSGFAFVLPMRVLCALFDLPDERRPPFYDWAASLRAAGDSMSAFGAAMNTLHTAVTELVAQQRAQPGKGLLAALLAAGADGEPPLSDIEAVATVLLLTIAGYETTAVQFGNGFLALCQHPDQLALLKSDESLVGPAVEEILRYAQAATGFAGSTTTTVDVELFGVVIPAGATVFASLDSAGRDEAHVTEPQKFDLRRGSASRHIAFGSGSRHCLGASLARIELQEGFGRLLRRFPDIRLAVDVDNVQMGRNMFSYFPRSLPITW
jgi:cytochrome P450